MFEFNNKQKQSPGGVLKKGVLENFANFTGKNLCQSLFFLKKLQGLSQSLCLRHANVLKKTLGQVFSLEFCEIFEKMS